MSKSPKPSHTIDYSSGDPTQYAVHEGFNSQAYSESQAYCESSYPDEPQWNSNAAPVSTSRSWHSSVMSLVVIVLTAFGLAIAILATMKLTEPSDATPSEVMTHSVTTTVSGDPATPAPNVTVTIAPTGSPQPSATVATPRPAPPATMTNPVVTTTVVRPEPAPATMTNPVVTTTVTNPVVTTTVTRPEPAPATMTNPLEPPATMTNPLEPPATMTNPMEPEGYEED